MNGKFFELPLENYLRAELLKKIKSLLEERIKKHIERKRKRAARHSIRELTFQSFFLARAESISFDDIDFEDLHEETKGETFSEMLLRLIEESGEKNSAIYTRANIDRRHFSKIAKHNDYKPSKQTVLAFALALKLDFDQTQKLLASAGYILNKSILSDLIVSFFIEYKIFDVDLANQALYKYKQALLGG